MNIIIIIIIQTLNSRGTIYFDLPEIIPREPTFSVSTWIGSMVVKTSRAFVLSSKASSLSPISFFPFWFFWRMRNCEQHIQFCACYTVHAIPTQSFRWKIPQKNEWTRKNTKEVDWGCNMPKIIQRQKEKKIETPKWLRSLDQHKQLLRMLCAFSVNLLSLQFQIQVLWKPMQGIKTI